MHATPRSTDAAPRSPSRRTALVVGAVTALVAGTVGVGAASAPASTAGTVSSNGAGAAGKSHGKVPYLNPRLSTHKRVKDLLSRMTLAEKIGQMTQAERANATPADVTALGLGSILSGGGSVPADNSPEGWADMVDGFQQGALATRLKIPVLYGVDAVHGHANLYGATVFPHNIGLGATRDPRLVEKVSHITAEETRATGTAVELRALPVRGARRPVGPLVRELRRVAAARLGDGRRGPRPAGPTWPARQP